MVTILPPRKNLGGQIGQALGTGLGHGLAQFVGNYRADKALQQVLDDPKLKGAPLHERYSELQRALAPHGQYGEQRLQNQMIADKMAQQENEQGILSKMLFGGGITKEEFAGLPVETQFKVAQIQREQQKYKTEADADETLNKLIESGELEDLEPHQVYAKVFKTTGSKAHARDTANLFRMEGRESRLSLGSILKTYDDELKNLQKTTNDSGLSKTERQKAQGRFNEVLKMKNRDIAKFKKGERKFDLELEAAEEGEGEQGATPKNEEDFAAEPAPEKKQVPPSDIENRVEFLNKNFLPQDFKGKRKQDKSGRIYQSDGKSWQLVHQ